MDQVPISRVVVETEPDWLRVKGNVAKGVSTALEARLASLPGGKEGETAKRVRKELETRLAKIQEEMFRMSVPNLRVNGHNYEDFVDATEPFDEMLDRKIWALNTERVEWDIVVAGKRKKTPADIARLEEHLEMKRTAAEWLPEGEEDELDRSKKVKADEIPRPPRHQGTIETFNTVVSNLSELIAAAPAQLTRAQRAQTVRSEIANMPA